jgi:hypothetical protein
VRKLRAQGMVPKAGDVVELRGVFAADQFTGDLKTAAEKLSSQAGRPLDDPRNLGSGCDGSRRNARSPR